MINTAMKELRDKLLIDIQNFKEASQTDKHLKGYREALKNVIQEALRLSAISYQLPHYFNAPDEDKSSRFCRCGKYLTDDIHLKKL